MKPSQQLQLRQTQTLAMTAQLQQAIQLLQLSNMELATFLLQELAQNPLLAAEEVEHVPLDSTSNSEAADYDNTWNNDSIFDDELRYKVTAPSLAEPQIPDDKPNLRQHLLAQINVDFTPGAERQLAIYLVDCLDESGYFTRDLGTLAGQLGTTPAVIEDMLVRLQKLDPAGIFARSLAECLRLQLHDRGAMTPAFDKMLQHLDLVGSRNFQKLCQKCGVPAETLESMLQTLRRLDPKPGQQFNHQPVMTVIPDVIMQVTEDRGWRVELNQQTLPKVYVDTGYYELLRASKEKETKTFVSQKFQSANWIVKAIHQRTETILAVAQEIIRQQENFFRYGIEQLRPLTLREIAEAIDMHESTISRVTTNKYMATPQGLFELKYFFSSAVKARTTLEGSVASESVKARIKQMIIDEDKSAPLSDQDLSNALQQQGIDVARRTVAKYRESLKLPPAHLRRVR